MTLAKAKLASSITFIVLVSFTIVTYDRQNMLIIQATEEQAMNLSTLFLLSVILPSVILLSVVASAMK